MIPIINFDSRRLRHSATPGRTPSSWAMMPGKGQTLLKCCEADERTPETRAAIREPAANPWIVWLANFRFTLESGGPSAIRYDTTRRRCRTVTGSGTFRSEETDATTGCSTNYALKKLQIVGRRYAGRHSNNVERLHKGGVPCPRWQATLRL